MGQDEHEVDFDVEKVMAEIKVATPEFVPFLAWCAANTSEDNIDVDSVQDGLTPEEFNTVVELIYSYSRDKNEEEEAEMYDRG